MKKIFIGLLIFVQLFFCASCFESSRYWYFDFKDLRIKYLEIGYLEEYYPEYGLYGGYEVFLIIEETVEKEILIKELSSVKLKNTHIVAKTPVGNCVKIVLEDDSYYIMSISGTAEYTASGEQKQPKAPGRADRLHFLSILSQYVELKDDGTWNQNELDSYCFSLKEN